MSVDKIILRAILSTLAAIGILIVFAFVALVAAFPATTMEMAYDLGMENSCVRNAERVYKRSGDIYFIAYATDVAISADNYKKTVSCGKKMIADEEFMGYCAQKDEEYAQYAEENNVVGVTFDYEQYIYGKVCVAEYELGDKQAAVTNAFEYTTGFKKNNAVVAVFEHLPVNRRRDFDRLFRERNDDLRRSGRSVLREDDRRRGANQRR